MLIGFVCLFCGFVLGLVSGYELLRPQYVVVADDMWYFGSVSGFRTAAPVFMVHDSYLGVFFSGCVRKRIQPALFWFQAKSGRPLYHTCEYVSAGSL